MTSEPRAADIDIRRYMRVVRRRAVTIVLITVLTGASAFAFADSQTRKFRTATDLLFTTTASDSLFGATANPSASPTQSLASEIKILHGQAVRDLVVQKLGYAPSVSASANTTDNTITITATSTNAERAALFANTYAQAYIANRRSATVDDITSAQKAIQAKIDQLQGPINDLDARIAAIPRDQTNVINGLNDQRQGLASEQSLYRQQVDSLQLRADLTGGVKVVTPASVPGVPFTPRPKRTAALGAGLGLMFGLGLAFLLDYLDDSVKGRAELEQAAPGLPVLAMIPYMAGSKNRQIEHLVSLESPGSIPAEAYRTLRTSIQFMTFDKPVRSVQITSPGPGEGKSLTVANLAVALARAGQRVILVGCDLRRPRVQDFFDLENEDGFTSVMLNNTALGKAVRRTQGLETLRVLPSGPIPPNPSELLSSSRAGKVLKALEESSDIVLIDSPPVLPVTDAAVLSKWVDATVCVVSAGETTRRDLHRAIETLHQVDAKLVGIILNGVRTEDTGYGYGYGYGPKETRQARRKGRGERASEAPLPVSTNGAGARAGKPAPPVAAPAREAVTPVPTQVPAPIVPRAALPSELRAGPADVGAGNPD